MQMTIIWYSSSVSATLLVLETPKFLVIGELHLWYKRLQELDKHPMGLLEIFATCDWGAKIRWAGFVRCALQGSSISMSDFRQIGNTATAIGH